MANRLDRLISLTYRGGGCHDPQVLRTDVAAFIRRLRRSAGLGSFAYAWVPELHPGGHGLHAHVAVGAYLPKESIEAAWGYGFVDVRRLASGMEHASTASRARVAAAYLSKYATKQFTSGGAGLHRYEVAEGHQPRTLRFVGEAFEDVLSAAIVEMGGAAPAEVRSSFDWDGWRGPVARWMRWAG